MSKAFTKEDVDPPERSGRVRSASGLPPGAVNYLTALGAGRLRKELEDLKASAASKDRRAEITQILKSATIVEPTLELSESVTFGAQVTVRDAEDHDKIYRIVGVDELEFWPNAVSWISPDGKALLAAELGGRLTLDDGRVVKVVKIDQPAAE
ncbi:MAG: GreA/GreB family elongation factor [Chthoniobacterales bacterium]